MDNEEQEKIKSHDIICLTETWIKGEPHLPHWIKDDYNKLYVEAEKTKVFGRASGGIMTLFRKTLKFKGMKLNSKWIISEARIGDETFVVVNLYLKPDLNINQVMEEITQEINTCTENTEYPNIIVGGDLNGRVGELSYLEDDITEVSGCITNIRNSRDKVSNSRGRMIQLTMEELGLVLLNGRVKGDEIGRAHV